jgi:Mn2+/Fe2+ NRAMP family transporter
MFIYISFGNIFFIHSHTLADGKVIIHSHIHESGTTDSQPSHTHSQFQLEVISNLNLLFNVLIAAVIVFTLFFTPYNNRFSQAHYLQRQLNPIIVNRGPPTYSNI